jgi:hypothetical protein
MMKRATPRRDRASRVWNLLNRVSVPTKNSIGGFKVAQPQPPPELPRWRLRAL